MRIIFNVVIVCITLFTMVSCGDSTSLDWDVDIYTKIRKSGNDTIYALSGYAYAYQPMSKVSVSTPTYTDEDGKFENSQEISLRKFIGLDNSWILPGLDSDYSKTYPIIGDYTFYATTSGGDATYTKNNTISKKVILPTSFVSVIYDATSDSYKITWNWMSGVTNYRVNLYKGDLLVAQSGLTREPIATITIQEGKGFNDVAVAIGDAVNFEVVGNVYETSTSSKIEIQASMVQSIVWGEDYNAPSSSSSSSTASSAR
ncbi:hypothetical protein K4L44_00090 [Halosquirtibacter laminarini]|uniref:Uncharacterized protein n=1 Tax=Halosquirtibacter laminarini TaxID=3374600 RepID=A0AC61NN43_9BACT|nr:hypothetical protein K4L44_00090 [Prolixibacteraceae bacterium]